MGLFRKRNEFRKNKLSGHPNYVGGESNNHFLVVGITESPKTQNQKNIRLDKNPNPKSNKIAHLRPQAEAVKKNKLSKNRLFGWKFTSNDQQKANKILSKPIKKRPVGRKDAKKKRTK